MKTQTVIRDGIKRVQIIAARGKTFRRIHDGFVMGSPITLGLDFSTGIQRDDLPEYYEEIDEPQNEI